jgi:arylsulfatase A-like enzyme
MSSEAEKRIDRRAFLKKGAFAASALTGGGIAASRLADAMGESDRDVAGGPVQQARTAKATPARPNILVIIVDQLRFPQWLATAPAGPSLPANLLRLEEDAVCFGRHYTASNDCTPSRSALLTGLYTHQTGCLVTGGSTLDPGFPTWGSMLREQGYHARWYGKWHLTHGDNHWGAISGAGVLERYGFAGGTYPSPDGAPGQGWRRDPAIAGQFERWLSGVDESQPWCATVSFVNPHDIAWWYRLSDRVPGERYATPAIETLPPNFETPELLIARGKPRLQRSLQETAAASFGAVPFSGPDVGAAWLPFLNLYVKLQEAVDRQVGRVLDALESRPRVAANTVILFTSDHGEYGASHGLRGKGAGVYEEGIRVPLLVKDPRGVLTRAPEQLRSQLTSSVDVAPLLLTIATGSNEWRGKHRYAHLADRLDLSRILADPGAPGRSYVLHATDEIVTEYAIEPYAADAPLHLAAIRTPTAKYATYSHWPAEGTANLAEGQETELYDFGSHGGRLELENGAGASPLEGSLRALLARASAEELRRPLPRHLRVARERGFADYFTMARHAVLAETRRRSARAAAAAARRQRHEGVARGRAVHGRG